MLILKQFRGGSYHLYVLMCIKFQCAGLNWFSYVFSLSHTQPQHSRSSLQQRYISELLLFLQISEWGTACAFWLETGTNRSAVSWLFKNTVGGVLAFCCILPQPVFDTDKLNWTVHEDSGRNVPLQGLCFLPAGSHLFVFFFQYKRSLWFFFYLIFFIKGSDFFILPHLTIFHVNYQNSNDRNSEKCAYFLTNA